MEVENPIFAWYIASLLSATRFFAEKKNFFHAFHNTPKVPPLCFHFCESENTVLHKQALFPIMQLKTVFHIIVKKKNIRQRITMLHKHANSLYLYKLLMVS